MSLKCERDMGGVECGAPAKFICRSVNRAKHYCLEHIGLELDRYTRQGEQQWDVLGLSPRELPPAKAVQLYADASLTSATSIDPVNFHTGLKIIGECPHHGSYVEVERTNGVRYMARWTDLRPC